ncbi:hypothetical protein D3C78_1813030 [compost metagenome]
MLAGVIGIKNMATLANGDQALTGPRDVDQGAAHGQGTGLGGQVQHIDISARPGDTLHQSQQRTQQRQQ